MNNERGLSAYQIKVIAIIAMTIDHIAWMWVPAVTAAGQCMHTIGRITAPIMCYLLVEGYIHTHDVRKYTFRDICGGIRLCFLFLREWYVFFRRRAGIWNDIYTFYGTAYAESV